MKSNWILIAALAAGTWGLGADRALAGDSARLGTSGAQELRIPVGPRGTALSGAATADASGVEALYWNPAGVVAGGGTEVLFSTMSYLVDSNVHFMGLTKEIDGVGAIGVAVKAISVGAIAVTTEEVGGPTGETYSPNFSVIGLTMGRQLTERVALGVTANLVNESVRSERATGVAFDIGLQYNLPSSGFHFGAVMKNFGPEMGFHGPGFGTSLSLPGDDPSASSRTVVTESASFELPGSFQVGATYDAFEDENGRLRVLSAFQSSTFTEDAYRMGAEYSWRNQLFARGGVSASTSVRDVWGATYGAGVRAMLGGTSLLVDYTRQTTTQYFDDQDLVSLTLRF